MNSNQPKVIECQGTSYEIGRQYGEAAKDNIFRSKNFMFSSLKNGIFKVSEKQVLKASKKYFENVLAFDPEAVKWVEGIADGAGISFEESFALKCVIEIGVSYPHLAGMCTSFAISDKMTRNGTTILGQNIDWYPNAPIDLLHIRHTDGTEQLCICLAGNSLYYLTSDGLGNCANLTLAPMGPVTTHVPLVFYLWKSMRQQSLEKAMDILRVYARGTSYYHLVDKYGNMAGIESIYDDFTEIEPKNCTLIHANHYVTEKYKKSDLAYTFIQDSFDRAGRLETLISGASGKITPQLMMNFLADHQNHPHSICNHIDKTKPQEMASMSIGSFIMVPGEMKMYVSYGPPCENKYVEYSLT